MQDYYVQYNPEVKSGHQNFKTEHQTKLMKQNSKLGLVKELIEETQLHILCVLKIINVWHYSSSP